MKQSLMEAVREATHDNTFSEHHAPLCERTEPSPIALEEAVYYPGNKHVYLDVTASISRNYLPDMSSEPTPQQEVLMLQAVLDFAVPVMDPVLWTDVITTRDIAAVAKSRYFPKNGHNYGALSSIDHDHCA